MIYLSKGGAGADSDHTWIRPWYTYIILYNKDMAINQMTMLFCLF